MKRIRFSTMALVLLPSLLNAGGPLLDHAQIQSRPDQAAVHGCITALSHTPYVRFSPKALNFHQMIELVAPVVLYFDKLPEEQRAADPNVQLFENKLQSLLGRIGRKSVWDNGADDGILILANQIGTQPYVDNYLVQAGYIDEDTRAHIRASLAEVYEQRMHAPMIRRLTLEIETQIRRLNQESALSPDASAIVSVPDQPPPFTRNGLTKP